jgi:hypothetical protein
MSYNSDQIRTSFDNQLYFNPLDASLFVTPELLFKFRLLSSLFLSCELFSIIIVFGFKIFLNH